jgi:hypothetical protein
LLQDLVQLQTTNTRHAHIGYDALAGARGIGIQKGFCTTETYRLNTGRLNKTTHQLKSDTVIVNQIRRRYSRYVHEALAS